MAKEYIEKEAVIDVLTRYLNAPHLHNGSQIALGMRIAVNSCIALIEALPQKVRKVIEE